MFFKDRPTIKIMSNQCRLLALENLLICFVLSDLTDFHPLQVNNERVYPRHHNIDMAFMCHPVRATKT